jgi:hypothetical protein
MVSTVVGRVLHGKQALSLSNAVWGAMRSPRLSITSIGHAYANAAGIFQRHGVKQVDRIVGNQKIDMMDTFGEVVRSIVGARKDIKVSLDWTEYDGTDQSRIAVNLITRHGRATPLLWITVTKSKLANRRSAHERRVLKKLKACLAEDVHVEVIADRGFCSTELFRFIHEQLRWDYTIRIRSGLIVYEEKYPYGRKIQNIRLVRGARPRKVAGARLTESKYEPASLVLVWDRRMKEPWYLVSSRNWTPEQIVKTYARRFTCEEQFRDEKDDRYGAGSKEIRVSTNRRRDMLTLIHALATVILTVIGEAGERLGYDRRLRANTVNRRTHSLYAQGKAYLDGVHKTYILPFKRMVRAVLQEHAQCIEIYGVI